MLDYWQDSLWQEHSILSPEIKKKYTTKSLHWGDAPTFTPFLPSKNTKLNNSPRRKKLRRIPSTFSRCNLKLPTLSKNVTVKQKIEFQQNRLFSFPKSFAKISTLLVNNVDFNAAELQTVYRLVSSKNLNDAWINISAFKIENKYIEFRSTLCNLLFHTLAAKAAWTLHFWRQAIQHYHQAQFFAMRKNLDQLVTIYLWEEAQILSKVNNLDECLHTLNNALQLSVVLNKKNHEFRILEKIGLIYYYLGNSAMSQHYYKKASLGLTKKQKENLLKQFDRRQALKLMETKIFKSCCPQPRPAKKDKTQECQITRLSYQNQAEKEVKYKEMVKQMVKKKTTVDIGLKMRKNFGQTQSLAEVRLSNGKLKKLTAYEHVHQFSGEDHYQLVRNCSQVLKSHLNRDRSKKNRQLNQNSWPELISVCKGLFCDNLIECSEKQPLQGKILNNQNSKA